MANRDIIVIGASAGGVEALIRVCRRLPADLPASVFIVQHVSPSAKSFLPRLLRGPLEALSPQDGDAIERGKVYVAPPDHHLLLREGRVLVRRGPHENRSRPSADALFRSAAVAYGPRVIGVVLTGMLDDGANGLIAIKKAGGVAIVQDPEDAAWPSMPREALERNHVDHSAALADIPNLLDTLSREEADPARPLPADIVAEARLAESPSPTVSAESSTPGAPSRLSCPECGGVLNEISGSEARYRCQTGHAFTYEGLVAAQGDELERALGIAARTHRDRMRLYERLKREAEFHNRPQAVEHWTIALADAGAMASLLESALASFRRPSVEPE